MSTVGEAVRHIKWARTPGKTTHERQQHILTALEQLVFAVQELERKIHDLVKR